MKLIELYDDFLTVGGIITDITTNNEEIPWPTETEFTKQMDIAFYGNFAGEKAISPLVQKLLVNGQLSDANKILLAKTIWNMFSQNWINLHNVLIAEYDPIENYRMSETEKIDGTNTAKATDSSSTEASNNNTNQVYGFNSSNAVNSDKQSGANTAAVSSTTNTTDINKSNRELTRSGNIGVTTSQQMIQSSIDLYSNWNYWMTIFTDISSVLCSGFWED